MVPPPETNHIPPTAKTNQLPPPVTRTKISPPVAFPDKNKNHGPGKGKTNQNQMQRVIDFSEGPGPPTEKIQLPPPVIRKKVSPPVIAFPEKNDGPAKEKTNLLPPPVKKSKISPPVTFPEKNELGKERNHVLPVVPGKNEAPGKEKSQKTNQMQRVTHPEKNEAPGKEKSQKTNQMQRVTHPEKNEAPGKEKSQKTNQMQRVTHPEKNEAPGKEKTDQIEMPPEKNEEPLKEKTKQTYYKSKFWEFIDPSKKESSSRSKEKQKNYDSSQVKSFMEKQKDLRKQKELIEYQERQKLIEQKKKRLQKLDDKCRSLVSKTNLANSANNNKCKSGSGSSAPIQETENYKLMHKELNNLIKNAVPSPTPTPAIKIEETPELKPTINRTTILLQEFETIVKRECKSIFEAKKAERLTESPKIHVDKAIGTTQSLTGINRSISISSCSSSSTIISFRQTVKDMNQAASKIQAAFKGYKERKILAEANILPRNLVQKKQEPFFALQSLDKAFTIHRAPEKPYDTPTKLLKQKSLLEQQTRPYIPPNPAQSLSSRVKHHPQTVSAMQKLAKSFNEPYPKEAIQRIQEAQAQAESDLSRRNSLCEIRKCGLLQDVLSRTSIDGACIGSPAGFGTIGTSKSNSNVVLSARRKSENIGVRSPSIPTVLFEKLRLLEMENRKKAKPGSSVTSTSPSERDFGSVSSITRGSKRLNSLAPSHDVSITDDYFGPSDSEVKKTRTSTPIRNHPPRLRKRSGQKSEGKGKLPAHTSSLDSTTTVDTDVELIPTDHASTSRKPKKSKNKQEVDSKTFSESNVTITSPGLPIHDPSTSGNSVPFPVLKLKYQAEKERLQILDKALQAKISDQNQTKPTNYRESDIEKIARKVVAEQIKIQMAEQEKETLNNRINELNLQERSSLASGTSLQLELLKCQQGAAEATKEMSKLVVELTKSYLPPPDRHPPATQVAIDYATIFATVTAAVAEAQKLVESRSRDNLEQKRRSRNQQTQVSHDFHPGKSTSVISSPCTPKVQPPSPHFQQQDVSLQFPSCSERSSPSSSTITDTTVSKSHEGANLEDPAVDENLGLISDRTPDLSKEINVHDEVIRSEMDAERPDQEQSLSADVNTSHNKSVSSTGLSALEVSQEGVGVSVQYDEFKDKAGSILDEDEIQKEVELILSEGKELTESIMYEVQSVFSEIVDDIESVILEAENETSFQSIQSVEDKVESPVQNPLSDVGDKKESVLNEEEPEEETSCLTGAEDDREPDSFLSEVECEVGSHISGDVSERKMDSIFSADNSEHIQEPSSKSEMHIHEEEEAELEKDAELILPSPIPVAPASEKINLGDSENKVIPAEVEVLEEPKVPLPSIQAKSPERSLDPNEVEAVPPVSPNKSIPLIDLEPETSFVEKTSVPQPQHQSPDPVVVLQNIENKESAISEIDKTESVLSEGEGSTEKYSESAESSPHKHPEFPEPNADLVGVGGDSGDREHGENDSFKSESGPDKNEPVEVPIIDHFHESKAPEIEAEGKEQTDAEVLQPDTTDTVQELNKSADSNVSVHSEIEKLNESATSEQSEVGDPDPESIISDANSERYTESFLSDFEKGTAAESVSLPGTGASEKSENEAEPHLLEDTSDEAPKTKGYEVDSGDVWSPKISEIEVQVQTPIEEVGDRDDLPKSGDTSEIGVIPAPVPDEDDEKDSDGEEDSDKAENLEELTQKKEIIDHELRVLEAIQAQAEAEAILTQTELTEPSPIAAYLSALELQSKPPPPYSPYSPTSSESVSEPISSAFDITVAETQLRNIVTDQVTQIWDTWSSTGQFLQFQPYISDNSFLDSEMDDEEDENAYYFRRLNEISFSSFESGICAVVQEKIKSLLRIEEFTEGISFVDQARVGSIAIEAQKQRIPKTKEALINLVCSYIIQSMPISKLSEDVPPPRRRCQKWTCRHRDLVDEVLVEEMIKEEPQWTELWPEELLLTDAICDKILSDCLKEVVHNFCTVLKEQ